MSLDQSDELSIVAQGVDKIEVVVPETAVGYMERFVRRVNKEERIVEPRYACRKKKEEGRK